ncbi:MAG: helix-turn-helix transcriptional regulator [Clostridia bacterium]|nr:helix-turn-helix transcriptional regulator [Clostridia bacterium]
MMKTFCERLKELRLENNLTTTQLGELLGVNNSTVSRWERGEILPSIEHVYNICKRFDISSDYLLGLID